MIVPTLRVGMPLGRSASALLVTPSVRGCMPTRSVGTIVEVNVVMKKNNN